jgi:ubiquinone biosynthesis protein COQ9
MRSSGQALAIAMSIASNHASIICTAPSGKHSRALAILAQPQNAMAGARLAWRAADRMWRIAGDRATDFNHYTKRGILSALYTSTMLVYLDDDSEDLATTRGFLDRRINDVMNFEKLKASWRSSRSRLPSLSRFLGRLRYPAV